MQPRLTRRTLPVSGGIGRGPAHLRRKLALLAALLLLATAPYGCRGEHLTATAYLERCGETSAKINIGYLTSGLDLFYDVASDSNRIGFEGGRQAETLEEIERFETGMASTLEGIKEFKALRPPDEFDEFHEASTRWFDFLVKKRAPISADGIALSRRWLDTHLTDEDGGLEIWFEQEALNERESSLLDESQQEFRAIFVFHNEMPADQTSLLNKHKCDGRGLSSNP